MDSLTCLPNELLAKIVALLDQNSITNFCLTCTNFNKVGNSQLKKRIVVVPKTTNNVLLDSFELLQTFTYGFTKVKEDHFTELYSRDLLKATKELACLELYKRKKLQDYVVKLPQLENFFTFDHRSYRWYEDFRQYRMTPNVNLSNQYHIRTRQRSSLRPYNEPADISSDEEIDELDAGNVEWRAMVACNEVFYDYQLSDSDEEDNHGMNRALDWEQLSTSKLCTTMNEGLKFFKFSKYGRFQKLKYLYLTELIPIDEVNFSLELNSALFLCRYDRMFLFLILRTGNRYSPNQSNLMRLLKEYTILKNLAMTLNYDGSTLMDLPIKWEHLKELRFALAKPCKEFPNLGASFASLEILYVHDLYGIESQESILDFIMNIKENILQQIIIFAGGQFRLFQVRKYIKEKIKKVLFQQKSLWRFTIRYGISSSIEAEELINLQPIIARSLAERHDLTIS